MSCLDHNLGKVTEARVEPIKECTCRLNKDK